METGRRGLLRFVPTLDDIAAATAEVRSGWSPGECHQREKIATNAQVELLASILRPLAVEMGLRPVVNDGPTGDAEPVTTATDAAA